MELKQIALPILNDLQEVDRQLLEVVTSSSEFVTESSKKIIANGGKRLRPALTLLSSQLGIYNPSLSVRLAMTMELMHTATLLHDDVLDAADLRRGEPSANAQWGNVTSILIGDFFYCRAMDLLVSLNRFDILRLVTNAITDTTVGEIEEIRINERGSVTEEEYWKIITGKTARLMSACCEAGALLGGLSKDHQKRCATFGLKLGLAFQVIDDLLDCTATTAEFGKTQGTDLREGKTTLPFLVALQNANAEQKVFLKALLKNNSTEIIQQGIQLIIDLKGGEATLKKAQELIDEAKLALAPLSDSLAKQSLLGLADFCLARSK